MSSLIGGRGAPNKMKPALVLESKGMKTYRGVPMVDGMVVGMWRAMADALANADVVGTGRVNTVNTELNTTTNTTRDTIVTLGP